MLATTNYTKNYARSFDKGLTGGQPETWPHNKILAKEDFQIYVVTFGQEIQKIEFYKQTTRQLKV